MATKEKNRQIVLLTIFAMLLVVAGHSDITSDFKELWIYKWAYSFHMPLFFFISGFLFALTMPNEKVSSEKLRLFVKKKAVRLLIPFLFINTIIFFVKSSIIKDNSIMQNPVEFTWASFLYSTFMSPVGFMWFLPALFVIFLIVFVYRKLLILNKISDEKYFLGILICIVIVTILDFYLPKIHFMQISQAIHYSTYFLLGLLYCDYKSLIDRWLKKYYFVIVPIFLLLSVSLAFKGFPAAICGIIFSVIIALILENRCPDSFVKISGFCYTVFLLSYFPQMYIRGPIAHLYPNINQYVLSLISFIVGLIIPISLAIVYSKLKTKSTLLSKVGILIGF